MGRKQAPFFPFHLPGMDGWVVAAMSKSLFLSNLGSSGGF